MSSISYFILLAQVVLLTHGVYSDPLCTFSEELIQEYDNAKGTTPIEAELQINVGIGKSSSGTAGGGVDVGVSKSNSSSTGGEAGFSFFGISASVKHEVTTSSSSSIGVSRSWALTSEDTWNQQSSRTTKYSIPPGTRVKLYQDIAQCGEYRVRNSRIRRDDEDATPIEELMRLQQLEMDDIQLQIHNVSLHIDLLKERQKLESHLTGLELELKTNITISEIKAKQEEQSRLKDTFDRLRNAILDIHLRNTDFANKPGDRKHELDVADADLKRKEQEHRHEIEKKKEEREHEIRILEFNKRLKSGQDEDNDTELLNPRSSRPKKISEDAGQGEMTIVYMVLILLTAIVLTSFVIFGLFICIRSLRRDTISKYMSYSNPPKYP